MQGFEEHFKKLGGVVSKTVSTLPDESDFRSVIVQVLASKPEVIYAPITSNLLAFFRQLRQLGFNGSLITSDNLTEDILLQGNKAFEGVYQTMVADPSGEKAAQLAKLYEKKFLRKPTMLVFHGWGYDGVHLIAHALKNSDLTRRGLRDALLKVRNFPGVGGAITFSSEGSWRMPLKVFKVENHKFVEP